MLKGKVREDVVRTDWTLREFFDDFEENFSSKSEETFYKKLVIKELKKDLMKSNGILSLRDRSNCNYFNGS